MNNENLEKGAATRFKSGEEAAEAGKRGGVASGEIRRERASIKAALLRLLAEDIEIDGMKIPAAEAIALQQIRKAAAGDRKSAEYVRDSAGQRPAVAVEVSGADKNAAAAVEALIMGGDPGKNDGSDGE